jgi:hypothetical protein
MSAEFWVASMLAEQVLLIWLVNHHLPCGGQHRQIQSIAETIEIFSGSK